MPQSSFGSIASIVTLLLLPSGWAMADDLATVRIEGTSVQGTTVFVDGYMAATLPASVELTTGSHRFLLQPPQGEELMAVTEVVVEGAPELTFRIDQARQGNADVPTLRVFAPSDGAQLRVAVDGRNRGIAPVDIPLGSIEKSLVVQASTGELFHVEVLTMGPTPKATSAPATTTPAATGKVTLHSEALRGAKVTVDGEPRGVLPLQLQLSEGVHQLTIEPIDGAAFTIEKTIRFDVPGMGLMIMLDHP